MIRVRPFDPRAVGGIVLWLDDTQAVGQWTAKHGPSATQTATNNQPSLATSGARSVLSFDGINDTLSFPAVSLSAWHAFAVANPATSSTQTVLHIASSGTQSFSMSSSASGLAIITASGSPSTSQALYGADSRVGAGWSGGALKDFFRGTIGEILVYDAVLSASQVAAINRYLSGKWGL